MGKQRLEQEAETKMEFTKDELLSMNAKALGSFPWYLYLDDKDTGLRTVYEPMDIKGVNYVQRGKPFPIPKNQ